MAISADDAAAGGGEIDILAIGDGFGAVDAEGEFGEEAGFLKEIELEREEGFFEGRGCQVGEDFLEHVEDFGVGIVFLKECAGEIGGVDGEVEGAEIAEQRGWEGLGELAEVVGAGEE